MAAELEAIRTAERERWDAVLSSVPSHDFYHLPRYHEMAERNEGGEARLLVHRSGRSVIALPVLIRRCDAIDGLDDVPFLDATSVYGYAGPVSSEPDPPASVVSDFQSSLRVTLDSMGVVDLFTSLHPLIPQASLIAGLGDVVPNGLTVSIDLALSEEDQLARYRSNHIRDIRKLRAMGVITSRVTSGDLGEFVPIYYETMRRLDAAPYYFFDRAYFADLAGMLGSEVQLFTAVLDGTIIAAGLFFVCGEIIQYHLGGTIAAHVSRGPMKLVLDAARRWATGAGLRVLHLGGGLGGHEDSLLHFKAGFSDRRHVYSTWRWVLDRAAYDQLTVRKSAWNAQHGQESTAASHFPSYRGQTAPIRQDRAAIEFRRIGPADADLLGQLLPRIDSTHFQPHPMTVEGARIVAGLRGRDVYLVGLVDGDPVAYGMLRGWDEGYPVASLGIGVTQDSTRHGFGTAMMNALHDVARQEGATRIRLRVHPDNVGAAALYRAVGYRVDGTDRGETVMIIDL